MEGDVESIVFLTLDARNGRGGKVRGRENDKKT